MFAFAEYGIAGAGPLESHVPKGVIRLSLSPPSGSSGPTLEIYGLHLQSEPFVWDPRSIRNQQLDCLRHWMRANADPSGLRLFIGDFNIAAHWADEFRVLQDTLQARPADEAREYVTICNLENTSHSKWAWRIGGALYRQYQWDRGTGSQLDHALVTARLRPCVAGFGVFPLKDDDGQSLTDHEGIYVVLDANRIVSVPGSRTPICVPFTPF